jgi:hypothetical protein
MSQTGTLLVSFLLPLIVIFVVTAVVSRSVSNAPTTQTWKATKDGVAFVVSLRRWQRVLIRTFGTVCLALGSLVFLSALTVGGELAMGIARICLVVGGMLFLWLAHGMARLRLEVTPDTVWAFRMAGAPRQVPLSSITELAPLHSNNYGGVVARSATAKLFYVTRIMLGYAQLIDYFRTHRPDLTIPDVSLPM